MYIKLQRKSVWEPLATILAISNLCEVVVHCREASHVYCRSRHMIMCRVAQEASVHQFFGPTFVIFIKLKRSGSMDSRGANAPSTIQYQFP